MPEVFEGWEPKTPEGVTLRETEGWEPKVLTTGSISLSANSATEKTAGESDGKFTFTGQAKGLDGSPIANETLSFVAESADGSTVATEEINTDNEGKAEFVFEPDSAGEFTVFFESDVAATQATEGWEE